MTEKNYKIILKNQHYFIVGNHSSVQICRWTKNSVRGKEGCYKEKFYGIKSHLCCQMTPCLICQNQCLHCWRAIEFGKGNILKKAENPEEIISECILGQRKLLSGFKGYGKADKKKLKEAENPKHFAISLIGEPTLYPKLSGLIRELRKQGKTSFLVTNGLRPEAIKKLKKENALPTQLYVSLNYPDEKIFKKITRNKNKNAWMKFNETLKMFPDLPTRKVIRIALIRDLNMDEKMIKGYAKLIKKANPDFLEIKGYMAVGFARQRLGYERMPRFEEIKSFSEKLLKELKKDKYRFLDEHEFSRVVLLGKNKKKMRIKENEI